MTNIVDSETHFMQFKLDELESLDGARFDTPAILKS